MTEDVRYGVLRPHRSLAPDWLGPADGRWELIENIPAEVAGHWVQPTNRFETRSDGARALVFEVCP